MQTKTRQRGMTLLELMVVVGLVGVMAAVGAPLLDDYFDMQRARGAAREIASSLTLARAEAIRTGNAHIVFLTASATPAPPATDPAGTALDGPVVVLNDGAPPTAANCVIDGGEARRAVQAVDGVAWGFSLSGGAAAPGDVGAGAINTGSSFATPAGAATTWVMFRPDGVPVAFDNACNQGTVGSGGGAIYITNGFRDYAVVLTPLGGVRVHSWAEGMGAWTN